MNALILHGRPDRNEYFSDSFPSPSNSHWIPWLQACLLRRGILTQAPEMPEPWRPDYRAWRTEFERYLLNQDTILVSHSLGCGFLLQWLTEHPNIAIDSLFLVAPSMGDQFFPNLPAFDEPLRGGFCDFELSPAITAQASHVGVIYSDNDNPRVQRTVDHLKETIPAADYRLLSGYGHFTASNEYCTDGRLPELLEVIEARIR